MEMLSMLEPLIPMESRLDSDNSSEQYEEAEEQSNLDRLSLLNHTGYSDTAFSEVAWIIFRADTNMVRWLKQEKADSIRWLMTEFRTLQHKHGLRSNITVDKWFNLVYNPPLFPVGSFNLINPYKVRSGDEQLSSNGYYVCYYELQNAYRIINEAYFDWRTILEQALYSLFFALSISLLIFSFRITSGKSWLVAFMGRGCS